jgi:hypothetical protein
MNLRVMGFALISFAAIGCRRDAGGLDAKQQAEKAREQAAARALIGEEDEGGGGNAARENVTGTNRWRDTVVYVDGKPTGVLRYGELPVALKPTWVDEKVSAEIEPGTHGTGYAIRKARRYRFADLLTAMGVDLKRVNELHIQGPKTSQVLIVRGSELRTKLGRDLMFRFGSITGGKALPVIPGDIGNHQHFDKIAGVMVYVDKKPPVLIPNEGLALDGKEIENVPYYGEPMRGGMRIYLDDKLAVQVKKWTLQGIQPASTEGGLRRYGLFAILTKSGVDTSKAVDGWVIANERRTRRLTHDELARLTVAMGDRHKNELTLDGTKFEGESIALHSHVLAADELPQVRPDEI